MLARSDGCGPCASRRQGVDALNNYPNLRARMVVPPEVLAHPHRTAGREPETDDSNHIPTLSQGTWERM